MRSHGTRVTDRNVTVRGGVVSYWGIGEGRVNSGETVVDEVDSGWLVAKVGPGWHWLLGHCSVRLYGSKWEETIQKVVNIAQNRLARLHGMALRVKGIICATGVYTNRDLDQATEPKYQLRVLSHQLGG